MEWFDSMLGAANKPQRAPQRASSGRTGPVRASAQLRASSAGTPGVSSSGSYTGTSAAPSPAASNVTYADPVDSASFPTYNSGAASSGPIVEEIDDQEMPVLPGAGAARAAHSQQQQQAPLQLTYAAPAAGQQQASGMRHTRRESSRATKQKPTKNILVLGKQHAGKSAFVNTYRKCVTGGDNWATAPVGRAVSSGTDTYEPYYAQSRRGAPVEWVLVDTAGRRCNKHLEPESEEAELYGKMLKGMEWKTDLLANGWRDAKPVPQNAIDHVIFVIPATDIIPSGGLLGGSASLAKVKDLASRFAWWEKQLGNAPFVVVTHLDSVSSWTFGLSDPPEVKMRNCLGQILHKNRVFCITNPDDPLQVSRETEKALKQLHEKILCDLDARTSFVLKGRNSRWAADESEEEEGELERAMSAPVYEAQRRTPSPATLPEAGRKRYAMQSKTGGGSVLWSMPVAQ